jgi:hypothetical protein
MRDFYVPKYRYELINYLKLFIPIKSLNILTKKDLIKRYYAIRYRQSAV